LLRARRPGEPTQHRKLRDGELAGLLDELAVPLTPDERAALDTKVRPLRFAT
jgi:N-hydroxyarylamine O-acetyltransferase